MNNLKENLISLQEKAKERTVKTQSIEYDLETLIKKIDKGILKLDPEYQRRHRWDTVRFKHRRILTN
jgi:adenine-specific DNA methylase